MMASWQSRSVLQPSFGYSVDAKELLMGSQFGGIYLAVFRCTLIMEIVHIFNALLGLGKYGGRELTYICQKIKHLFFRTHFITILQI